MAIMIKTPQEIEKMRISGKALRQVHDAIAPHVVPGASTMDLEEIAVKKIAELGALAAFKGYHGYPAALCTSVNDEVVHGMPNAKRILAEGDILSIDCGVIIDGFYSDAAVTLCRIGEVSAETRKLLKVTLASLEQAIRQNVRWAVVSETYLQPSRRICEAEGASGSSARFVGHGIGRAMHEEDPQVPNFGDPEARAPVSRQVWSSLSSWMINRLAASKSTFSKTAGQLSRTTEVIVLTSSTPSPSQKMAPRC